MAPARVPMRRKGDGSMPQPGWTGDYDWAGVVPFDELPRIYNPPSGIIVNANARLVPDDYRHFISRDWAEPYRQRRANAMLREVERHPFYGMIQIQADNLSPDAAEILPLLLAAKPRTPRATQVYEMMGRWNRLMLAGRAEPLIYNAWLLELQRGVLADEFGPDLFRDVERPQVSFLVRVLRDRSKWCDDIGTAKVETCDDVIAAALERALDGIARNEGPQIETWQWGHQHLAAYRHPLFDRIPLLRDLASVRFPADGGANTLNRGEPAYIGSRPFEAVHGATYRGVYDLGDLDNSRFAIPLGQSGNMLSPYAHSYAERWQRLNYLEIPTTRAEAARTAIGTITLSPPAR
jgi:penicillin amidase